MRTPPPRTPRAFASLGLLALTTLGLLGCPDDEVPAEGETGGGECGQALLPGDLVISELVADVEGADAGLEWFEIYNASGETLDLEGLTLIYERVDGSSHKEHVVARSVELTPGGYAVVGGLLDELAGDAAHVDYGYGGELGEFGNQSGYLAIGCGGASVIDEVYYQDPVDSASRTFDGSQAPDAVANDNLDSWCDARTPFSEGFAATPGAANDVCGSADTCMLDGEAIEVIHPAPGELVITEVLPDPEDYADADAEWIELHSLATADVHLNGLDIGKNVEDEAEETIASEACIVLAPGAFALLAKSDDPALNGELPAPDYLMAVSLTNDDSSAWIGVDGELLDAVSWANSPTGSALNLDPSAYDPALNDDPANWCPATVDFNTFNQGSPRAANEACPLPPPPEGSCYQDGELRDIVPLEPGDLEITEVHANPACTDDGDGEFFELFAKASGDLNGLQVGKAGAWAAGAVGVEILPPPGGELEAGACISVSANQRLVFAHEASEISMLPVVDLLFDMALNNSNSDLIIGYGDDPSAPDDQATWTSVTSGAASSKDSNGQWCDAVDAYGCGDLGTPGAANPACDGGGGDGMCLDPDTMLPRMINSPNMGELSLSEVMPNPSTPEPGGEWFELHASVAMDLNGLELGKNGAVSHTVNAETCIEVAADSYVVLARSDDPAATCMLPAVDYVYAGLSLSNGGGNNIEIGYAGQLWDSHTWDGTSNGAALSYDPDGGMWCEAIDAFGCGDLASPGAANPACEGGGGMGMCFDTELMQMRAIVSPAPGELVLSEFMANPDAVTDANGEWFEIHALAAFDLNELEIGRAFVDGPDHVISAGDCLALAPGDNALLARSDDPSTNGGLDPVTYVYSGLSLTNSNSALHVASAGELLDEISWTNTSAGSSTSLGPASLDPDLNDTANDLAPWCYASAPYGDGDNGSPGLDNPACN